MVTKKTKAIMICNPNNPTGKVYGIDELSKIADFAVKHNLFIFADEVYREFIFTNEKHHSLLSLQGLHDHVIIMDSISKRYSACGLRIGAFISRNKKVMKAALCFAQARLCAPTIDQLMAIPSVTLDQEYFNKTVGEYKARRDVVVDYLSKMEGVEYQVPDGAFYIIVKLPVKSAEDFIIWLLTDFDINGETIMLAPANGFYNSKETGIDELRIAFVLDQTKTKIAMNIFNKGLEKYTKQ